MMTQTGYLSGVGSDFQLALSAPVVSRVHKFRFTSFNDESILDLLSLFYNMTLVSHDLLSKLMQVWPQYRFVSLLLSYKSSCRHISDDSILSPNIFI